MQYMQMNNAIIMAAGASSRFAPLSYEKPKALLRVKGEVLIERQIRQLQEAGIRSIFVVVGYMAEKFAYLEERFGVSIVFNPDYQEKNNHSSLYHLRHALANSYICSADNYFPENPFRSAESQAYYSLVYADGPCKEWCVDIGQDGRIENVSVGGADQYYMLGHACFDNKFSEAFVPYLESTYADPSLANYFWEDIYKEHIMELTLFAKRFEPEEILEFDSLEELRNFDPSYYEKSGSSILANLAKAHNCSEGDIEVLDVCKKDGSSEASGFYYRLRAQDVKREYHYRKGLENGK